MFKILYLYFLDMPHNMCAKYFIP